MQILHRHYFGAAAILVSLCVGLSSSRAQDLAGRPAGANPPSALALAPYVGYLGIMPVAGQPLDFSGFQAQFGKRMRSWETMGITVSQNEGNGRIHPSPTAAALRNQLASSISRLQAAGALAANYTVNIETQVTTSTIAFGPQFSTHHFRHMVFFGNPAFGALRQEASFSPGDAFSQSVLRRLVPSRSKVSLKPFYGASGGVELPLTRGFGLRAQCDAIFSHPFNDLLAKGYWSYRPSLGLGYQFGGGAARIR